MVRVWEPGGTLEEIEGLRDAMALVFALRAGGRATASEILSLRGGTDLALIEALVGIIETDERSAQSFDSRERPCFAQQRADDHPAICVRPR